MLEREDRQGEGGRRSVADGAGLVSPPTPRDRDLALVESFLADREAACWSGGEPLRVDASVSGTVNRFSPHDVPADVWRRIEPIVKRAVTTANPNSPFEANHELSVVTQLVLWGDLIGQPLDDDHLFHPEFIDRFIVEGCAHLSNGSRLNYRTHLWKIGAAVLGHELFPARALSLQRSDVARPYSASEVADLVGWSRGLPTAHMRRNTRALLAIGLGAGLTSQELKRLCGTDVREEEGTVLVEVIGKHARSVPVRSTWAAQVIELALESGSNPFFSPERLRINKNDIIGFIERASGDGPARFNVQQLRVTWIVTHLAAGTHLGALERAAGVGVGQLGKYLPFAPPLTEPIYRRLLSGVT